jgi:hypothetical protein
MSKFYLIFILLILGSCSGNNGKIKSLEYDLIQI